MMRRLLMLVSAVVVLLGVSVAEAFAAPLAATDPVTAITATDATVNGTLDANGGGTTVDCHFDWVDDGTFQVFGFDAPNQVGCNEGSAFDDGAQAVTGTLGGLVPNALYHVRLVVSNATETTVATEQTFTTAAAPPTLDGAAAFASAITGTGAVLNGTVNPNNSATTYHFDYGTTTAYGSSAPQPDGDAGAGAGDGPVSTPVTGLAPGTLYHFRVSADNGTGGVQHGADQTFTTAPATPAGASAVTASTATLIGTVNPHGGAATYHFNYGTSTEYDTSTPETDGGAGSADLPVTRAISGLRPATTYHVQVVATDTASGVTTSSADATFTTAPAPVAMASEVTGVGTDHATLNGSAETHGVVGSYRFTVTSTTSAYVATTPEQPLDATAGARPVSAVLADLPPGGSYRAKLVVTSNGATSASDEVVFSTAPLALVIPPPTLVTTGSAYGCAAPRLAAYDPHPKPGTAITITGSDLGVGGSVVLGTTPLAPTGWSAGAFTVTVPDDATGSLPLTINCGAVSNTIAIQVYQPPSNRFTATVKTKGATATLTLRVPGRGSISVSGANVKKATKRATKAGTTSLKAKLTSKAVASLKRHHKLTASMTVRFTPTGGTAATKTVKATFKESK